MDYTGIEYPPLKPKLDIKHSICSVNVLYQNAPVDLCHISLIYIYWSVDHNLKKTGLENLEQLLYLCIFWFWILITASSASYQSCMFLNSTLFQ